MEILGHARPPVLVHVRIVWTRVHAAVLIYSVHFNICNKIKIILKSDKDEINNILKYLAMN